jgi:hypothetical protein
MTDSGSVGKGSTPAWGARSPAERGDLYVCTWLFAESEGDESTYPQVHGRSSSQAFQATYWRCVALFFASSHRHHPHAKHLLFTNVENLPSVSGVDMGVLLERLGIEVVRLPLTFATPQGHFHAWRNQFYVFDITAYLAQRVADRDAILLLDSDCVWIRNADAIHEALDRDGLLTYVISFPIDWIESGLTREDMRAISSDLLRREVRNPLEYCGGEFLAATGAELRRLQSEVVTTWNELLARYADGKKVFNEEAQLLSHVYEKLGCPLGNGNPFVRRIWTGSFGAFNTALPYDLGLVVWHLPLEKKFGIRRLFPAVADPASRLWSTVVGDELRDYLGANLGVPRNDFLKSLRDLVRRALDRMPHR